MKLETLKDVDLIDGFVVGRRIKEGDSGGFVRVDHVDGVISFKIQNGPIKENGVNGCQVDTMIDAAAKIIKGLNEKFSCEENNKALQHLYLALENLKSRKANRLARGVEGESKI